MAILQTVVCKCCGAQVDFSTFHSRRKYCSYKCKRRANQLPDNAASRKRYSQSTKGKANIQRKSAKYYQSTKYKARTQSPEYRKRSAEYFQQRRRNRKPKPCLMCEDPLPFGRKKFCSDLCIEFDNRIQRPAKRNVLRRCPGCKQPKYFSGTYCCRDCYRSSDQSKLIIRQARHRRRARMHNAQIEDVDPLVIAKRDKYKCHICRKRVNMDLENTNKYSKTMDHLIPVSLGGDHTYANIRLAHRICNSRKGNRAVNEQLLLFG